MYKLRHTIATAMLCVVSVHSVSAQVEFKTDRFFILKNTDRMMIAFWNEAELRPVDTTRLRVTYSLEYKQASGSDKRFNMLVVLQLGTIWQKYYSMIRQFTDSIAIDNARRAKQLAPMPGVGIQHTYTEEERFIDAIAGEDRMNSEIWINVPGKELTERSHAYAAKSSSIEYKEPRPVFKWEFLSETDSIAGYQCFTAKTSFRGREWTVWYTPDIPIDAGPWKFNGLPGLILQAKDASGDYFWTCKGLRQIYEPIVYYKVPSSVVNRDRWRRYMRRIHEAPVATMGGNSSVAFYHATSNGLKELDVEWVIPYNPIELE